MKIVKLKECCIVRGGFAFKSENYEKKGVPLIRIANIENQKIKITNNTVFIGAENFENSNEYFIQKGDILVALSGATTGKFGVFDLNEKALLNQRVALIRVYNKLVHQKYIYYYFFGLESYIFNKAQGVAQPNISTKELEEFKIPLPTLSEQKLIAEILDKADLIRQKRKESIALLDEFLRSVFLDMFGDPVRNEKGWEIKEFGNIISSIKYGTGSPPEYSISGIPFIRATNIKNGTVVEKGLVYISNLEANTIEKCKLKEGDLVLVRSGINSGDCAIINNKYSGSYAGYDLIIEINYPNNFFSNYFINSVYGKRILKPLSRRAGQPHLNAEQIQSMKIINPPIKLLIQFAKIIEQVEATKAKMEESLKEMDNQFNAFLQKAFKNIK